MSQPPEYRPNPYEEEIDDPTIRMSAAAVWFLTGIFLGMIALPPLFRNVSDLIEPNGWVPVHEFFARPTDEAINHLARKREADPRIERTFPSFIDHRESWEAAVEDAEFIRPMRQFFQRALTGTLNEGNRKTVIGGDGWLFFRPAIDSLTGYGPLKPEPTSVAKDPTLPPWNQPEPAILAFGEQLREAGVELLLVPIPVKPMIYGLGGEPRTEALRHPDAQPFYDRLRDAGIEVLDLADTYANWAQDTNVFLKQDTHWTPRTMERSALLVADAIKERPWFASLEAKSERYSYQPGRACYLGDLVEKLDLGAKSANFRLENVNLTHVRHADTKEPVDIYDQDSPVILLGDSFTNIFSAEAMHWGEKAGFAQHLAHRLGITIDTIAQNGQASTGVRQTLAMRPGALEGKKIVVWAIAARDLFLSETVARETTVNWRDVLFQPGEKPTPAPDGALVVSGELIERAALQDPKTVPYPASLYAAKYRILERMEGDYDEEEVLVYHWGFRDRELLPSSGYQVGDVRELTLVPFDSMDDLQSVNRSELDEFLLLPFWSIEGDAPN